MAHIVTPTLLLDSSKTAVVHVYVESDGVSSDLSNYVLIDPNTDFYNSPLKVQMAITQVWYSLGWFDALLTFDDLKSAQSASTPPSIPSWLLTRDGVAYHDFRYFGGLKDQSSIDGTGRILLSTSGLSPAGSKGTFVIEIRKNV